MCILFRGGTRRETLTIPGCTTDTLPFMRCLTTALLLLSFTTSASATPTFCVEDHFDSDDRDRYGPLAVRLSDSATPDMLAMQDALIDALLQFAEATYIEGQFAFSAAPAVSCLHAFRGPIWSADQAPEGLGSVIYTEALLTDAISAIPPDIRDRALVPYLAAWPMLALAAPMTPLGHELDMERLQAHFHRLETLAGWWIGQQPQTEAADLLTIARWRTTEAGALWDPAAALQAGYALRALTWDELQEALMPVAVNESETVAASPSSADQD